MDLMPISIKTGLRLPAYARAAIPLLFRNVSTLQEFATAPYLKLPPSLD